MNTFKVCISWIITSFNKCFETSLHKCANTTAKYSLLTKEVCLCLYTECSFKKTSSCSADSKTICQCKILSFSCVILLYSDKTRCSFSSLILTSYCMTRCFRSDHCNVNILWWFDASEMDIETMSKH